MENLVTYDSLEKSVERTTKAFDVSGIENILTSMNENIAAGGSSEKFKALEDTVSQETTRATTAEENITADLSSEVTRATNAEADITKNVTNNTTKIGTVESNLTRETERATGAESELNTKVTKNTTDINNLNEGFANVLGMVQTETTRAKAAEAVLDKKIDDIAQFIRPKYEHYAFIYHNDESDPPSIIEYPADCDNANYTPAKMNYETDEFEYGSWKDAFFIRDIKVAMLGFDGSVLYEIDKNDYTKKVDGTDVGTEGNVMVGWPTIWTKIVDNKDGTATIHFANTKLDSGYRCYAHRGLHNNIMPYKWISPYDMWVDEDGKGRSLTGKTPYTNHTATDEIAAAEKNNVDGGGKWHIGTSAVWFLQQLLCYLIGKTTDAKTQLGRGVNGRGWTDGVIKADDSGLMDQKNLFYGTNDNISGVKAFGIEHPWGNIWQRCLGWLMENGLETIKTTYGTEDGSTTIGYNLTGDGYIRTSNDYSAYLSGDQNGWQKNFEFTEYGLLPSSKTFKQGGEKTYVTSYQWINASNSPTGVRVLFVGGCWNNGSHVGVACVAFDWGASHRFLSLGARLEYTY